MQYNFYGLAFGKSEKYILAIEFIIPFMNIRYSKLVGFWLARLYLPILCLSCHLCLIEYVREDLLSNFLTEPAERLKIWERGQLVKQGPLMEHFVLLVWPKFGGGLGQICPRPLFFPGSSIDSTAAAFLLRTTYHNVSYPFNFILCKVKGLFCHV